MGCDVSNVLDRWDLDLLSFLVLPLSSSCSLFLLVSSFFMLLDAYWVSLVAKKVTHLAVFGCKKKRGKKRKWKKKRFQSHFMDSRGRNDCNSNASSKKATFCYLVSFKNLFSPSLLNCYMLREFSGTPEACYHSLDGQWVLFEPHWPKLVRLFFTATACWILLEQLCIKFEVSIKRTYPL